LSIYNLFCLQCLSENATSRFAYFLTHDAAGLFLPHSIAKPEFSARQVLSCHTRRTGLSENARHVKHFRSARLLYVMTLYRDEQQTFAFT